MNRTLRVLLAALPLATIIVVLLIAPWGGRKVTAAGTAADIFVTNTATLTWDGGTTSVSVSNRVGTNFGGTWLGTNVTLATANAGAVVTNITIFTNDGNATEDFVFYVTGLGSTANTAWTLRISNVTDTAGGNATNLTIAGITAAGLKTVSFIVIIPVSETNGATNAFRLIASNENARLAGAVKYTGSNSVVYGGNMGTGGASVGTVWLLCNSADNWVVSVNAATMQLAKSAAFTNPAPYGAVALPIPGALIFYRLQYTNAGTATANNVTIVDVFNTNKLTFAANSLKKGAWGDTYLSAAGTLTSATGDDEGSYAAGDNQVFFNPGGVATGTPGTVNANGNGAFFYQLTLN